MEVEDGKYDPFQAYITEESDRSFQRNYDTKYQDYMLMCENRVAYQLSLRYFLDANPPLGSLITSFQGSELVLLDTDHTSPLHFLLVSNDIPHINIQNFSSTTLVPSQTLILSTDSNISPEDLAKITEFVHQGGLLLSFNKAVTILDKAFPGKLKYRRGETAIEKKIEIRVPENTEDKALFLGLENASQTGKSVRFTGVRRFEAISPEVQVLALESSQTPLPLAVKIPVGAGLVFHFSHLGTDEVLELRSKDKAKNYVKQVQSAPSISEATKEAWKTAFSCNQWGSFYLAISLLPFLDIVFGIINKYNRHDKK